MIIDRFQIRKKRKWIGWTLCVSAGWLCLRLIQYLYQHRQSCRSQLHPKGKLFFDIPTHSHDTWIDQWIYRLLLAPFGLAAFLFCWIIFVRGANKLRRKPYFRYKKHLFYSILFLLYTNLLLGFVTPRFVFPYSGQLGKVMASKLIDYSGFWGAFLITFLLLPLLIFWLLRKKMKKNKPTQELQA